MKFDPARIREAAGEDFDAAWQQGGEYLEVPPLNRRYPRRVSSYGRPHPIFDVIGRLREAYLRLGFDEAINPLIVEDSEVKKQFGSEALAVLDRCFYLAGLPRPDVGISESRAGQMKELLGRDLSAEEVDAVRRILHGYKKGTVEGDDLVHEISAALGASDALVSTLLAEVFPEFEALAPAATTKTLRSHMTSGWFITLGSLAGRASLPTKLFSIDRCFRREQSEDAARLMTYHSASCVIMDEDLSVEDGKVVADGLLAQFGFQKFRFLPDDKRSKYYVPDTQIEVYAYHPGLVGSSTKYSTGWVEVATFGIYSPTALSMYDVPYPVMNLGLGVERLAMILYGAKDLRALTYPQFVQDPDLSARDMAMMIRVEEEPETRAGIEIARSIVRTCDLHGDAPSPCEFEAWRGTVSGRKVVVRVVEPEENTKLCGPAANNEVLVYKENILGVPKTSKWEDAFENGVTTGMRFIDSFAELAARKAEEAALRGEGSETRVRIVRGPGDVNLRLEPALERYITSRNKKIDLRGPVFTTVRSEVLD
ncbi:O-phosphoserine--tRNA ligase [Methanothrix harundinacea]|uniref:O-phosphoserine--tRNA(Cys) ligase n=1 Tax=Methanothrix harundinacea (strain 6Ac) TaxID=1110509 RepID=G7WLJ6_METH6|nr:O-phosphoserine--tRNA ligase [Methanothrix harundinacea]AET64299.1 O-phosphoseryl-tRNA(Cys) synthetase [Methanothrix harundinacea 6Ac]